jgi:gliding motility-associated-like protein
VTDPIITCPGDRTEYLNNNCEFIIPDYTSSVSVIDNCDPAPSVSQSPAAGTILSGEGTVQAITILSTDSSGNSGSCAFNIVLHDNTLPVIICLPDTTITVEKGIYRIKVSLSAPVTTDNCGIQSVINDFNGGADASGIYQVGITTVIYTVTDQSGNTAQCSQQIIVSSSEVLPFGLVIPQGFSPNNDGLNDTFEILGMEAYPENELFVYNLWGYEVYYMHGYNNSWDGTASRGALSDQKLPTGTYYYILKLGNEQVVKGFVYLIKD